MPRTTTPTYLSRHYQLKAIWRTEQRAFAYLSPTDQWNLHRYFQFVSDKTEEELAEHRRNVYKRDPSLPQRAGRAYAKFMRGEKAPVTYSVMPDGRRISVRAVMRPEPDVRMLAKVIWQMALDDVKRKDEDDQAA